MMGGKQTSVSELRKSGPQTLLPFIGCLLWRNHERLSVHKRAF